MIRAYLAGAAVVVGLVALGWAGKTLWEAGYAACGAERAAAVEEARRRAALAAEMASRKEAERLDAEARAARMAAELEDLANADPAGVPGCLSAARVRRLNSR